MFTKLTQLVFLGIIIPIGISIFISIGLLITVGTSASLLAFLHWLANK